MSNQTFDFSEALRRMKEGKKVRRIGWEKNISYTIGTDKFGLKHVYIAGNPNEVIVEMSCGNILATNWEEVEG